MLRSLIKQALPGGDREKDLARAKKHDPGASSYVNSFLKREVMRHAEGRCEYVGQGGRRCEGRKYLHFDHVTALSLGGKTELGNLQVLCAGHNLFKAKQDHVVRFVDRKISVGTAEN